MAVSALPITVLHLITDLDRGGAEIILARLVARTDRARFRPVVVSLADRGSLGAEIEAAGVPLYTLGMRRGTPSLGVLLALRRILRRERPQLVQTWLYHADFLGLLARPLGARCPLLWHVHSTDVDLAQYGFSTRVVRRLLAWASRLPAGVLINSMAARRDHERLGYRPRRWEMMPNGFDVAVFRPDPTARQRSRAALGVAPETSLIGIVARVDPMKDHVNFLAAAERVLAQRQDVTFVMIGRGTDALALSPAHRGRVLALGERRDLPALLPALDLAVLSSAFGESFPTVLGEAMACGVPCIATDVGDSAIIIGDTGAIVPRRDPAALAGAILGWLARPAEERQQAARAARQRIVDNYQLGAMVERYEALFADVACISRASGPS